ncbi:hypothetical protein NE237_027801 [Protea cynaroides]|uniref:MATH domain-containing protein n=1 Tax=Protea cynaroides TaxID=273540 RepID=A0A9Q0GP81_9MAGN|nr:hypothetical protein NE237_027801 [Protea cynaroides]
MEELNPGIKRSFRDVAPSHYIFKIESFSSFLKNSIDKHESLEFEAGGYQWRLALHPNGNKSRKGQDHISLYLVIAQPSSLPPNWEINVIFSLFVHDQIHDKYLTVQDATGGGVRRFHALKTEWGFDQFIQLSTFNDPANGFLLDDTCAFGAEVFVIESAMKAELFSMIKNATAKTYILKIPRFSLMEDRVSEVFIAGDYKWDIQVYPRGYSNWKGVSLSIFLNADFGTLPSNRQVYVNKSVRVVDQISGQDVEHKVKSYYSASTTCRGWSNFLQLGDLKIPEKGYLLNDTCIIEAEVTVLGFVDKF